MLPVAREVKTEIPDETKTHGAKPVEARMKRAVLFTLLAAVSVAPCEAKWEAFFARGSEVLHGVMEVPERAIPQKLLADCRCVAVFGNPGGMFVFKYAYGAMTCRAPGGSGWGTPAIVSLNAFRRDAMLSKNPELVLLVMTPRAAEALTTRRFLKLGKDAVAAPGAVGRDAGWEPGSEGADILAWARSRGVIGGVALEGAYFSLENRMSRGVYGKKWESQMVMRDPGTPLQADPAVFASVVAKYAGEPAPAVSTSASAPAAASPPPAAPPQRGGADIAARDEEAAAEILKNGLAGRTAIPEIQPPRGSVWGQTVALFVERPKMMIRFLPASEKVAVARAVFQFSGDSEVLPSDLRKLDRGGTNMRIYAFSGPGEPAAGGSEVRLPRGIGGFRFQAQEGAPLMFILLEKYGLVHIGGRGRVIFPDGRQLDLAAEAGKERP